VFDGPSVGECFGGSGVEEYAFFGYCGGCGEGWTGGGGGLFVFFVVGGGDGVSVVGSLGEWYGFD